VQKTDAQAPSGGRVGTRPCVTDSGESRDDGLTVDDKPPVPVENSCQQVNGCDRLAIEPVGFTLSRHYDVSPAAILQANGYKGPRALSPGQQLIIPRLTTAAATTKSKAVAVTTATPSVHIVNRGDTMLSIARRNHVSIAELAKANNLDRSAKLKLGMKLTVPSAKTAAVTPAVQPRVGASTLALPATKLAAVTPKLQEKARLAQATTTPAELSTETPVKATEATGALPTFRWPVRGRVITSYGAKTNGKANDSINLSVPEGTPVRAAEDGVVDYSGMRSRATATWFWFGTRTATSPLMPTPAKCW